jgi:hypothetical protein
MSIFLSRFWQDDPEIKRMNLQVLLQIKNVFAVRVIKGWQIEAFCIYSIDLNFLDSNSRNLPQNMIYL